MFIDNIFSGSLLTLFLSPLGEGILSLFASRFQFISVHLFSESPFSFLFPSCVLLRKTLRSKLIFVLFLSYPYEFSLFSLGKAEMVLLMISKVTHLAFLRH